MRSNPCMDKVYIGDSRVLTTLCYPRIEPDCVRRRVSALEAHGIQYICPDGRSILPALHGGGSLRVLGKGHLSVVVKALLDNEIVALKIRRTDSKKPSLIGEAHLQEKASIAGVAPKLYMYERDFIVMEYVEGEPLVHYFGKSMLTTRHLREILEAAWILDSIGILHRELTRPHYHVYFKDFSFNALILDYDSAILGTCGSLNKVASWIIRSLIGFRKENIEEIVRLLSRYRRESCSRELYEEISSIILAIVSRSIG